MCRIQAFMSLLLLGLKFPRAKGNCEFLESEKRCVCSLLGQSEIQNFLECFQATTYELRGGNLEQYGVFSDIAPSPYIIDILTALQVSKLIFTDLLVPEVLLPGALEFASYPSLLLEIEFVNCTFLRAPRRPYTGRPFPRQLASLHFHKVTADTLLDRISDWSGLTRWLGILKNLTLTESRVTSIPCNISQVFTGLQFLDVSGNYFWDKSIKSSFCQGAFPELQTLKLRHNRLTSYDAVCETVGPLGVLTHLDLSQNNFPPAFSSSSQCVWPESLRILNLSNTGLEHMEWSLPPKMEILDLSANQLFTLHLSLPTLKELYLSNNRLQAVPSIKNLPRLKVLSVDGNQISDLSSQSLLQLKNLQVLKAGDNPYNCSCASTIQGLQKLARKWSLLAKWPLDYTCQSPSHYRDFLVKDLPPSGSECNTGEVGHGSAIILLSSLHLLLCLLLI